MEGLKPALTGSASLLVEDAHTAANVGSGRVPVLASPTMIALMEAAAVNCIEPHLGAELETLGVHVDVTHTAPTPVGETVTATAELAQIDGRKLVFMVEARDETQTIGKGRHTRVIVDAARFLAKVRTKAPSQA